ncbi:MAG TPA: enoyl-CoA hydratase-related protein, partial [Rhodanobacteraceae bacterium]|nr:enoyl-CoA hydratase-related protein [Rhodanobacteraceae bacterium]
MFEGLRFENWHFEQDVDGIVTLTLDRAGSSVNTLGRAVIDELQEIVERLSFEPPKGVVIRSAKAGGFAVGADLDEFAGYARSGTILDMIERGQKVFQQLARLPCPTVCAIHGHCMGGGTEMALACRYRVAARDPSTKIALPEVKLGLHPGWGGTARLPRLIGAPHALELMLTGRAASAENAKAIGLVDALAAPELLVETAKDLIRHRRARPFAQRFIAWATNIWPARQILAPIMKKQAAAKARPEHYPAPFALIEVWRRGGSSLSQRLKLEARSMAKLAATPTCRNLIRVFFLQERLKGLAG